MSFICNIPGWEVVPWPITSQHRKPPWDEAESAISCLSWGSNPWLPSRVPADGSQSIRYTPDLLRGVTIDRPNQVWATDITYIPMARGFMYLIAIMDWATRKVLSWRLSNTLDTRFCVEALKEALFKYGTPEIFNTDQGCQFTSEAFTSVLKTWNVKISMDGKGRFKDNIFIERLWRTLKYERIYLKAYETGAELSKDLTEWFTHYNEKRKHSSLDKRTPNEAYFQGLEKLKPAA
jgi:putative transposase